MARDVTNGLHGLPEDSGVGPEADEAERNDPGDSDGLAS